MELHKDNESKHARPMHPLPDDILKMPRNETVCQYCGVSYLIHNEIKLLEDRLKAAELELDRYRLLEERETELKQQLQLTTDSLSVTEQRYLICIDCSEKSRVYFTPVLSPMLHSTGAEFAGPENDGPENEITIPGKCRP